MRVVPLNFTISGNVSPFGFHSDVPEEMEIPSTFCLLDIDSGSLMGCKKFIILLKNFITYFQIKESSTCTDCSDIGFNFTLPRDYRCEETVINPKKNCKVGLKKLD